VYKSEPGQLLNIEQILAGQVLMSKSEPGQFSDSGRTSFNV